MVVVVPVFFLLLGIIEQGIQSFTAINTWLGQVDFDELAKQVHFQPYLDWLQTKLPFIDISALDIQGKIMDFFQDRWPAAFEYKYQGGGRHCKPWYFHVFHNNPDLLLFAGRGRNIGQAQVSSSTEDPSGRFHNRQPADRNEVLFDGDSHRCRTAGHSRWNRNEPGRDSRSVLGHGNGFLLPYSSCRKLYHLAPSSMLSHFVRQLEGRFVSCLVGCCGHLQHRHLSATLFFTQRVQGVSHFTFFCLFWAVCTPLAQSVSCMAL